MNEYYKTRLLREHAEISYKLKNLKEFLRTDAYEELSQAEQDLLITQQAAMKNYHAVLSRRLLDEPYDYRMDFSDALALLKEGRILTRSAWDMGVVVFRQVPQSINVQVIPRMTSLPEKAKELILNNTAFINYNSQCLLFNFQTGEANSWAPSVDDIFAHDWQVVSPNKKI